MVEVVIAMAVIAVVVVAVMMPVLASRGLLYNSEDVTKATSLAEQGLEIIKNNRDIGCQFDAINPGNSGGTYDIYGDLHNQRLDNSSAEQLVQDTGLSQQIYSSNSEYTGFTRKITLTSLDNVSFNPGTFGGIPSDTFDTKDQYYYVEVQVSKNGSSLSTVSTIMLKKWKDY